MLNYSSDKIYSLLSDNCDDGYIEKIFMAYFGTPADAQRTMRILRLIDMEVEIEPGTPARKKPTGISVEEIAETMIDIGFALGRLDARSEKKV